MAKRNQIATVSEVLDNLRGGEGAVSIALATLPEAIGPAAEVGMHVVARGLDGRPMRDEAGRLIRVAVTGAHIAAWARILPEAELVAALGLGPDGVVAGAPLRAWLAAQGGDATSEQRDAMVDVVAAGLSRVTATIATRRDALVADGALARQAATGSDWTARGAARWAQTVADKGLTVRDATPVRALAATLEAEAAAVVAASDAVAGLLPR